MKKYRLYFLLFLIVGIVGLYSVIFLQEKNHKEYLQLRKDCINSGGNITNIYNYHRLYDWKCEGLKK